MLYLSAVYGDNGAIIGIELFEFRPLTFWVMTASLSFTANGTAASNTILLCVTPQMTRKS